MNKTTVSGNKAKKTQPIQPTMNEIPSGLETTINGLSMMSKTETGYRELLCVLEAVIELNSWYTNYGQEIHERFKKIEERIIPEITTRPQHLDHSTWEVAKEIQNRHGHMSIHAAEAAAEYWQDQ